MNSARFVVVSLVLAFAASCYNFTPQPGQTCSVDGKCPEGLECFPDNKCYPKGAIPDCSPACSGAAPVCDKATLKCVGCLGDKDCPVGFVCAAQIKMCKPGCNAGKNSCAPDAGACDVDAGICRGCLADNECSDPANPRCEASNGRCVPCLLQNDNCPLGQYCTADAGSFVCKAGCKKSDDCASDGGALACCKNACADTLTDLENCGACGNACQGGKQCCAGGCADYQTEVAHCGGCGKACKPANVTAPVCNTGRCEYARCADGFDDCDGGKSNGCEVAIATDIKNCGKCNNACPAVPNGMGACNKGVCEVGGCQMGFADCNMNLADGCEIRTSNDVRHCGKCQNPCPNPINGQPACANGACGLGSCNAPFANCDNNAQNGCETNTNTTVMHCGGCGRACNLPNATPACINGNCAVASCGNGWGNCDNNAANGCETNILASNMHCGACGVACGANQTCVNGMCRSSCMLPLAECDNNLATPCETNTSTSLAHCGGCNKPCPGAPPNAIANCVNSMCGFACNPGFTDCDMQAPNGCEINTDGDPSNCGGCGARCGVANGVPGCSRGACTVASCIANFGNCDGQVANGCEANLLTDAKNCGMCGKVCPGACVNGMCAGNVVNCGGYAYPETTIVQGTTCTGYFNGCTGAREFRVVGCYMANPSAADCPQGFTVAGLMLIGQWAQAADINRFQSGTSVCMYSGGSSATTACGGTHTTAYCWPKGTACAPGCNTNCCSPVAPCSANGYQAPLLCVR